MNCVGFLQQGDLLKVGYGFSDLLLIGVNLIEMLYGLGGITSLKCITFY